MKKILLLIPFCILFTRCTKDDVTTRDQCVKVEILAEICGETALQLKSNFDDYDTENGWQNNGKTYDNVFFASLDCDALNFLSKLSVPTNAGIVLNAKISKSPLDSGTCAICLATLANRPKKTYYIKVYDDKCEALSK